MKVKLHIDDVAYIKKPHHSHVGQISNRVTRTVKEVSPQELADLMSKGHTTVLATMSDNKRNKNNMIQQQVVMLDFDNTEHVTQKDGSKKKVKTTGLFYSSLNEILQDEFIQQNAVFAYKTLSYSSDWEKFRVVFFVNQPLQNNDEVSAVYQYLLDKFPTADVACKDSARLFYGGIESIEINYNNILNVTEILDDIPLIVEMPKAKIVPVKTKTKTEIKPQKKEIKVTSKPNWQYIKEGNVEKLKEIYSDNYSITVHSPTQAFNYLKTLDMRELLGIYENPFIDLFHTEKSPSGSIFRIQDTSNWAYKCHSASNEWYGDFIDVIARLQGIGMMSALKFAIDVFNIKIVETEQIKEIHKQCDFFLNLLVAVDLKKKYPAINNIFWRYKNDIYIILNIFKNNIYEDKEGNIRSLTWMSTRTLSMQLYGTDSKKTKVSEILNLLTYTNWIDKLDEKDIPKELWNQIKETKRRNKVEKRSNVFELFLLGDDFFAGLNKQCEVMKANGFTKKGFSREYVKRTNGEEVANTVFVQDKNKKSSEKSDEFILEIHKTVLEMIEGYGYAVEKDVVESLRKKKWKSKSFSEYKFKQAVSEMTEMYGLNRVRLTNEIKKELGLAPSKSMPVIFIKAI